MKDKKETLQESWMRQLDDAKNWKEAFPLLLGILAFWAFIVVPVLVFKAAATVYLGLIVLRWIGWIV